MLIKVKMSTTMDGYNKTSKSLKARPVCTSQHFIIYGQLKYHAHFKLNMKLVS